MKILTCFIDTSAWIAIINSTDTNHKSAEAYLKQILQKNVKIITNNIVLDETLEHLKNSSGRELAVKFSNIIDESILTINLRMDWVSRRMRKNALVTYLKSVSSEMTLKHHYISESLKKKKADIIFTFDPVWKTYNIPIAPGD